MLRIETTFSSPNHESRNGKAVRLLVLHATVGSLQSAVSWLCNPKSKASTHYLISKTGRMLRLVDEEKSAWHAGRASWRGITDVNAISIGVELENDNSGRDPYPDAQVDALTDLALDIRRRYPGLNYARHLDVAVPKGRKSDPAGFPWGDWLRTMSPADPFARWGSIGKPEGAATGFAVPRAWLANQRLGVCVTPETYARSGTYSVTEFERGMIIYLKARNVALVELFTI